MQQTADGIRVQLSHLFPAASSFSTEATPSCQTEISALWIQISWQCIRIFWYLDGESDADHSDIDLVQPLGQSTPYALFLRQYPIFKPSLRLCGHAEPDPAGSSVCTGTVSGYRRTDQLFNPCYQLFIDGRCAVFALANSDDPEIQGPK